MSTSVASESRRGSTGDRRFPAYGPIEAVLGYLLFYVLVDSVTPAVVELFSERVLDLSPSFVRFSLAIALWVVLLVTGIDQLRRQLAALGVGTYDDHQQRLWSRVTPSSLRTSGYLLALVVGTAVAVTTFDRAVEALLSLIPVVTTFGTGFALDELFVLAVFFVGYGVAAHSFDRLVIDGVRALVSR